VADDKFNSGWLSSNWDEIWRSASGYQGTANTELSASELIGNAIIQEVSGDK
jgi:UDP-N-acetylglucosamine--N-acetylmuramyl-(pentapeptide) pyrophosphoryl-undecaprenol N-acetylglucosamine transferase